MEAVCAPFSFEAAHGVMPVMVMCCGATARRHVSKVAVVDVFCAFRVVGRVHLVVVVVVVLGSPWLFVALRGDHTAPRAGIATTRTALHHQNTQRKTSSLFALGLRARSRGVRGGVIGDNFTIIKCCVS